MATRLHYLLRPAKHIERQLLVEVCRLLAPVARLDTYTYLGFGALEYADFKLFHRALGIRKMVSLEKDTAARARYEFNVPFAGIELICERAGDYLPTHDWGSPHIVWLDYEQPLDKEVLRDCSELARKLMPGSVMFVTVNAVTPRQGTRIAELTDKVGEERLPLHLAETDLGGWRYAGVQRRILAAEIERVAASRTDKAWFDQVVHFRYADEASMLTLGWVVNSPTLAKTIGGCGFKDQPFVCEGEEAIPIKVPVLTAKEQEFLNNRLPVREGGKPPSVKWLPSDDVVAYANFYRWYPGIADLKNAVERSPAV